MRNTSESTSSFSVNIQSHQIYPKGLRLNTASIPFTWYPVNSINNKIYFNEDAGATLTAVLTPGNYTYATLATEIKTRMDAASTATKTYTVTYDATLNKFTIAISSGLVSFKFLTNTANSAYKVLGASLLDTTGALSYAFPNFPQLNSNSQIFIRSNALTGILKSGNMINGKVSNCLEVINVNADQGYYVYWENAVEKMYETMGPLPQNIDISITDFQGNNIDLRNVDCGLELLLE